MVKTIIRGSRLAVPDFSIALEGNPSSGQIFGAKDANSGGAVQLANGQWRLMVVGGTNNGITNPSVYKEAAYTDDMGQTFTRLNANFSPRNEIPYAQCNSGQTPTNRIFLIGGKSNENDIEKDASYFDETGFHLITSNMEGFTNEMGYFNKAWFDEQTGVLYCVAGITGDGRIIASYGGVNGEDYCKSWEVVGQVPDSFVGVGQYAFCKFKGLYHIAGIQDVGEHWVSADLIEWQLLETNAELFGYLWPDFGACDKFMIYQKGALNRSTIPEGGLPNNAIGYKGTYYSTDGINFLREDGVEYPGQHAQAMGAAGPNMVFQTGGNMHPYFTLHENIATRA